MDPTHLGPFTLLEKLGEGGMGVVYKARDTRLERFVAIKLLPDSRITDPERRARFIQEARSASALNHPNIITIYDIAEQDGRHYIVMEFLDGKPLNLVIPRKGMRVSEGLRIAAQVADALTAAHAAHIVHRDLKPGNIMVDANGRAKVLDFGLAKLTAPREASQESKAAAPDETCTVAMDVPLTEEGAIVGSVPYMSPEQAEGRPVDARSDIFSFGAVLYEMFTGQRPFQGETRISTLAAVVERDPAPMGAAAPGVPLELERVIGRCLRKDAARRSQHMSDVKLALEELRDESESGILTRPVSAAAPVTIARRRWMWPAIGAAFVAIIALLGYWMTQHRGPAAPATPQLVRVTPDDEYSYTHPAISPDGKFIASLSDRGGTAQVWLQQLGGGEPIQVTHASNPVKSVTFFPDGARMLVSAAADSSTAGTVEVVPTLGGQSRLLASNVVGGTLLSPDGRLAAYFDYSAREYHLDVISTDGGAPRVLDKWANTQAQLNFTGVNWIDSQHLLVAGSKRRNAPNLDEWEWFVLPLDGGDPVPTGAGDAIRAAGLGISFAEVFTGDRALFGPGLNQRTNVWEIRFTPGSWRVEGPPHQLTFGTENEHATSVSTNGTAALEISHFISDFYFMPVDPETGHAAGPSRRLTQDGRDKRMRAIGGNPAAMYAQIVDYSGRGPVWALFSLDLATSKQTELYRNLPLTADSTISSDGRQIAWTRPEGGNYAISVEPVGSPLESGRVLCHDCGYATRFTADARYLISRREARVKVNPKQKYTAALVEVATGKLSPWLEDPAESVAVDGLLEGKWVLITTQTPGDESTQRHWIAPFRPEPIPRSEWIEYHPPAKNWKYGVTTPFLYVFADSRLTAIKFDARQRRMSDPFPVRTVPGGPAELRPTDNFYIRGAGIVFERRQTSGSVWLMKLPTS